MTTDEPDPATVTQTPDPAAATDPPNPEAVIEAFGLLAAIPAQAAAAIRVRDLDAPAGPG